MYPNAVIILLLPFFCGTKAEGTIPNVFDNLDLCDPALVAKIKTDDLPSNMINQIETRSPWMVNFASYKGSPKVIGTMFSKEKIEIKVSKEDGTEQVKQEKEVNWKNLLKGEISDNLNLHIWSFKKTALVFGYYLCRSNGEKKDGEAKPHFGIAVAYSRSGGIPNEVLSKAEQLKTRAKELFQVPIEFTSFDMDVEF